MFRYLGFIGDSTNQSQSQVLTTLSQHVRSRPSNWREVTNEAGFQLYCTGERAGLLEAHTLHGGAGAILGSIFPNSDRGMGETLNTQLTSFGPDQTRRIIESQGRHLIASHWGDYVAFLRDPVSHRKWVLRDPTGKLPCYFTSFRDVTILFSYVVDCIQLGIPDLDIDWDSVRERVVGSIDVNSRNTSIKGVQRVYNAECIEFRNDRQTKIFYWNPIDIARSDPIEDPWTAGQALRSTLKHCTHALASRHRSIVHRLSGGLDSSIVLGCLADAPQRPSITCLTMYVPGEASNERPWARLAARRANCDHVEVAENFQVNMANMLRAVPGVRPETGFEYLVHGPESQLARDRSASASFSGDGGDSLLGAGTIQFAVSDCFNSHAFSMRTFKVATDTSPYLNISIWSLLARAVRDRFFNPWKELQATGPAPREFLTSGTEGDQKAGDWLDHPWFRSRDNKSRSPVMTAASLTLPHSFYDVLSQPDERELIRVAPLMSQPVVELCLRIPSYVHAVNGRSRGLARQAFVDDAPREILQRQWKDRPPNGIHTIMLEHNRELIRDVLLDGILVKHGLLDRQKLDSALRGDVFELSVFGMSEIFDHMNTECWLRNWSELGRSARYRKQA